MDLDGDGWVNSADCDDMNAEANPDKTEMCNGFDDDCDGVGDPEDSPACTVYHFDFDGDGYGIDDSRCLCLPEDEYTALVSGDCNDQDETTFPGAQSVWTETTITNTSPYFLENSAGLVLDGTLAELPQAWTDWGPNLLTNGGAESNSMTGWWSYSNGNYVTAEHVRSGARSFGNHTGNMDQYQHCSVNDDLAPYKELIQADRAKIRFTAWTMTTDSSDDPTNTRFYVQNQSQASSGLGSSLWSYSNWQKHYFHYWKLLQQETTLPATTYRVTMRVGGSKTSGSECDAFHDDMAIQVKTNSYSAEEDITYQRIFGSAPEWGVMTWDADGQPEGTTIRCLVRTSPDGVSDWGDWSEVVSSGAPVADLPGVTVGHKAIEVSFQLESDGLNTPSLQQWQLTLGTNCQ